MRPRRHIPAIHDHSIILVPRNISPEDVEVYEFFRDEFLNFKHDPMGPWQLFGAARSRFGDRRLIGTTFHLH